MKFLTKEWLKCCELNELRRILNAQTDKKIPFVFTNGGTECIAKEDLYTVKTNLNLTVKENEISFVMLPDTFDYLIEYHKDATEPDRKSPEEDILIQYVDRLRIITYLPDEILKQIKDKRMLAFGYAESSVKRVILNYIEEKNNIMQTLENVAASNTQSAECGLAIKKQLQNSPYYNTLIQLFDMANILNSETVGKDIRLTLETGEILILDSAEIIEEEESIINSFVKAIELHKTNKNYELHLLVMKRDKNYTAHFYNVTYRIKDLKLEEVK